MSSVDGGAWGGSRPRDAPPSLLAQQFARAKAMCISGDLDQARLLCDQMLGMAPAHPQVLLMRAELESQSGNHEQALSILDGLASRWPAVAAVHFCLGNALHGAGRLAEAAANLRTAVQLEPAFALAHCNLGLVLEEAGQPEAAIASYERAILLDPALAEARSNLGNALLKTEKDEKIQEAIVHLRYALRLRPGSAKAHHQLGVALQRATLLDEAIACHREAVRLQPDYPEAHYFLAAALDGAGRTDDAIACYRRAIAQRPDLSLAWVGLANTLRELGRFTEAIAHYERAIELDPELAAARSGLAGSRRAVDNTAELEGLFRTLKDDRLRDDDRGACYLAVAKLHDDAGRYDEAFAAAAEGNRLLRAAQHARNIRYDHDAVRANSDEIARTFTREFFAERSAWGNESEIPVFIVGYFRSGTTLVEQICASHSRVVGAGELQHVARLAARLQRPPSAALGWTRELIRRCADTHLERLERMGKGAAYVIDKLPDNLFNLGLIATMFPHARVVFCHRDGRDAALSVFLQRFMRRVAFSTDLTDAGLRWHETERMASLWETRLSLRVHHVQYEALVRDFEAEARTLIAFLGLHWEPRCLEFHKLARLVKTASLWQVRQPIYTRSVGRWRNYYHHLRPLCEVIGLGMDADTGARPRMLLE
jgi:tetratricopeptide (TPR) repeat protein